MSPHRGSSGRVTPAQLDLLSAVAIAVLVTIESISARSIHGWHIAATALAGVLLAAPVTMRRRHPSAALVCAAAAIALQEQLGGRLGETAGVGGLLPFALLSYSAGAWTQLRTGLPALLAATALFCAFIAGFEPIASAVVPALVALLVPWLLGRMVRERTRRAGAFRALALQTEREQAEHEQAAIAQERLRIGVELQDIIAHSVSAMVIGAAGARRLLRSDPEQARESIRTVEQTGRRALADMRTLLGVLKREEDPRALAPQPGLAQLETLLAATRRDGVAAELQTVGEARGLTPGTDLLGYRAVEAALACAVRRKATQVQVCVRYRREALVLEVSAEAPASGAAAELAAIRERVGLYGGRLELQERGSELWLAVTLPLVAELAA